MLVIIRDVSRTIGVEDARGSTEEIFCSHVVCVVVGNVLKRKASVVR